MLAHLGREPERRAVVLLSQKGDIVESWTRERLRSNVATWQQRFAACGLTPGDRVAVAPDRHATVAALHVALLASGLVVVPLNTALSAPEAAAVLDAAGTRLVVAAQAFAARVREACTAEADWWTLDATGAPNPDLAAGHAAEPKLVDRDADDEALVIHTSGTTGRPKSVPLSHRNIGHNLDTLAAVWRRGENDRLLHLLPLHHYHGLVLALYGTLAVGATTFLLPRFEPRAALDAIRRHGISVLMGVPTMYARILDEARRDDDLDSLRIAISGSAALGEALWRRFHARFAIELIERYGLTETTIVTSNPIDAPKPGSVGLPLADMTIAIHTGDAYVTVDPRTENAVTTPRPSRLQTMSGDRTPRGEICIAGPPVMRGYGNDPEANARSFREGFFHSGDLGFIDAEGYVWVDGRIKDLIIVGGSNVVPGEVERVLSAVHEAAELCVAGLSDSDLGEIVAAFVVARDDADVQQLEAALRKAAETGLAPYKRPRRYVFLNALPRNTMGKVDRAKLSANGSSSRAPSLS